MAQEFLIIYSCKAGLFYTTYICFSTQIQEDFTCCIYKFVRVL